MNQITWALRARGTWPPAARLAVAGAAALGVLGCGTASGSSGDSSSVTVVSQGSPAPAARALTITAREYSFDMPTSVPSGIVDMQLRNSGAQPHGFAFYRLNDGTTKEQLLTAVQHQDRAGFAKLVRHHGGVDVDPGATAHFAVEMKPGNYVLASLVGLHGGAPDIAKGMSSFFTVPESLGSAAAPSDIAGTITMQDFGFQLPAMVRHGLYQIVNLGPSNHEMQLLRLDAGKTLADVRTLFTSGPPAGPPPWGHDVNGGLTEMAPGVRAWLELDLPTGHYATYCFVKDASSNSHAADGMIADFTVA